MATRDMGSRISGIQHAKKKDEIFSAIACLELNIPKDRLDDTCVFSQYQLKECEKVGAMVYSQNRSGPLKWKLLCDINNNRNTPLDDEKLEQVHLFDLDYLKGWVQSNGSEFIKCPLCGSGAGKKRKQEEHQIETMQQLRERRQQFRQDGDIQMQYFTEKLILQKACAEKWDENENASRIQMAKDATTEVLAHWNRRHQLMPFNDTILRNAFVACEKDNDHIVEILVARCWSKGDDESRKTIQRLNQRAAKSNSMKSCELLCKKFRCEFDTQAVALQNAINTMNIELIDFLMQAMLGVYKQDSRGDDDKEEATEDEMNIDARSPSLSPQSQSSYDCRDVFKAVIRRDMVTVAKQIVQYRWHKPNNDDYNLAEKLDNQIYSYLQQRQQAAATVSVMANTMSGDGDGINLDDWGDDDDDDDMDEDDDWA